MRLQRNQNECANYRRRYELFNSRRALIYLLEHLFGTNVPVSRETIKMNVQIEAAGFVKRT